MIGEALARATGGRVTLLHIALLLTAIVYLPTFQFQFVYDDLPQIVYNHRLHSWASLPEYFTASFFGISDVVNQYRPLVLVWFRLNYLAFELSPVGWHLSTVLVHLIAVALVYIVVRRVTPSSDIAGVAALLFGVHPIHIETAAWIAGVSESLYACAALGAVYFYLGYITKGRRRDLLYAAGLFMASLLVKETALSILAVLAGCDWLFAPDCTSKPRRLSAPIRRLLPFFAACGFYLGARGYALRAFTHYPHPNTWVDMLRSWPAALWFYANQLLWPFTAHSQFYDVGFVPAISWNVFWAPLLGAAVVLGAFLFWARRSQFGAFSILWLVAVLPPLAGIYGFRNHDLVHDRYLYLPVLSVCILLAAGWEYASRTKSRTISTALLLALVVSFSLTVWQDEKVYRDDISLYTRGTETAPSKAPLWDFLGFAYAREGRRPEAISAHQHALQLRPDSWETHAYLGDLYFEGGELDSAATHLRAASELREAPARSELLHKLGLTLLRSEHLSEAEAAFRQALALAPTHLAYHYTLAETLRRQGRYAESATEFEQEVKLHNSSQARQALAEMAVEGSRRP